MPRPHLFLVRPRPLWHHLALGMLLGLAILAGLEYAAPWETASWTPTPKQHAQAVADGWIPGTDGYYRAIWGPDAY